MLAGEAELGLLYADDEGCWLCAAVSATVALLLLLSAVCWLLVFVAVVVVRGELEGVLPGRDHCMRASAASGLSKEMPPWQSNLVPGGSCSGRE